MEQKNELEWFHWEQVEPVFTIEELYRSSCAPVPEEQGVYFVFAPPNSTVIFQDQFWITPKRVKGAAYPAKTLEDKYAAQGRPRLLYIGKAGGRKGLRQRLRQYICHGYGETGNHLGGRAIWQVQGCEQLLVSWKTCPNPEQQEHTLLEAFHRRKNDYPLANWRL